jgi:hypothetical protein
MYGQEGGRLLGKGVYGCTYKPAPRCAGGPVFTSVAGRSLVGKVAIGDTTNELKIGIEIMKLPLASHYFALPVKSCVPALPIDDPDEAKCNFLSDTDIFDEVHELIMPDAGETLLKWSSNMKDVADNYIRVFKHLLEGMKLYQGTDEVSAFIHNDIHMGNIMIDSKGVARYIDVGLSYKPADVKDLGDANLSTNFRPKFVWQAPEIHAWRMMINKIPLEDGVKALESENPEYIRLQRQFPARKSALVALSEFMTTSPEVQKQDFGAFVRKYGKRLDAWRIGLCMWFLWDDLLKWPGLHTHAIWKQEKAVKHLLSKLTDFDIRERWEASKALSVFA